MDIRASLDGLARRVRQARRKRDLSVLAFVRRLSFMSTSASNSQDGGHDSELATLYRRAFADYRARALWNLRQFEEPTVEQASRRWVSARLQIEVRSSARRRLVAAS